jgi:transcriptional regulator with XRE-family HTH domain
MSQLDLALEAEISARHLSFMETGRARPSRDMVLRLARHLEVPLRERNTLLIAAGFAPTFPLRPLSDTALDAPRKAVEMILAAHEPFPALAVDRAWNVVAANRMAEQLMAGAEAEFCEPPVNVMRMSLHPRGLAERIVNFEEWRAHLLERLRREVEATADERLHSLLAEVRAYPLPTPRSGPSASTDYAGVAVPFRYQTATEVLSFYATTTVFGTAVDITVAELTLETFFPADAETAEAVRRHAVALGALPQR